MKRVIRPSVDAEKLEFNIEIIFEPNSSDLAATTVNSIMKGDGELDDLALADYQDFVETAMGLIDYYGFQLLSIKDSGSFPYTSKYVWIAYASDVEAEDIPLMIKVRISDHIQKFSPQFKQELKKRDRSEAEQLKLPKTKKKQKYLLRRVIVNNTVCKTYEEALTRLDKQVHQWLKDLNVDMSEYEERLGSW